MKFTLTTKSGAKFGFEDKREIVFIEYHPNGYGLVLQWYDEVFDVPETRLMNDITYVEIEQND
jgi:hypothetical protein